MNLIIRTRQVTFFISFVHLFVCKKTQFLKNEVLRKPRAEPHCATYQQFIKSSTLQGHSFLNICHKLDLQPKCVHMFHTKSCSSVGDKCLTILLITAMEEGGTLLEV